MFAVMHNEILLTPKIEAFRLKGVIRPFTFLLVKCGKRRCSSEFSARTSFHNMENMFFPFSDCYWYLRLLVYAYYC